MNEEMDISEEEMDYVLAQVHNEDSFYRLDERYKENVFFVIEFCKKLERMPQFLSENIINNRVFWIKILKEDFFNIEQIPNHLKSDKELMKKVMIRGYYNYLHVDPSLRNDKIYVTELIRDISYMDGAFFLTYMSDELKRDKEFIIEQMKNKNVVHATNVLDSLSEEVREDKDFLFELKDIIQNFPAYAKQKELLNKYERENDLMQSIKEVKKEDKKIQLKKI